MIILLNNLIYKGKAKLPLCLITPYAMKAYGGVDV
jgi:hypothetical protein